MGLWSVEIQSYTMLLAQSTLKVSGHHDACLDLDIWIIRVSGYRAINEILT